MRKFLSSLILSTGVVFAANTIETGEIISINNTNSSSGSIVLSSFTNIKNTSISRNGDSCSNNYDCDPGETCVKDAYGIDGVCAGGY